MSGMCPDSNGRGWRQDGCDGSAVTIGSVFGTASCSDADCLAGDVTWQKLGALPERLMPNAVTILLICTLPFQINVKFG